MAVVRHNLAAALSRKTICCRSHESRLPYDLEPEELILMSKATKICRLNLPASFALPHLSLPLGAPCRRSGPSCAGLSCLPGELPIPDNWLGLWQPHLSRPQRLLLGSPEDLLLSCALLLLLLTLFQPCLNLCLVLWEVVQLAFPTLQIICIGGLKSFCDTVVAAQCSLAKNIT